VAVSDTGIGIAKESLDIVLEPFGQVDSALSRRHAGTGLGLPLTKSLVELHGGRLDLDSELGKGTTVVVRFPHERLVAWFTGGNRRRSGRVLGWRGLLR